MGRANKFLYCSSGKEIRVTEYLIDIPMCAYNHEKYIARAIEGVINQRTNFSYRLILGEDCSTDATRSIIESYLSKYPEKMKVFFHEKNIGAFENSKILFKACTSKYVALCDGDDYWCDENKLQKQVDFLEANLDYAICFHRVYLLEGQKKLEWSDLNRSDKEETYTIRDLAKQNIIHTPSVIFRNGLFGELPTWFSESPVGDYVLHMLNAKHGLIKYFPEPMAVYRINSGGMWSGQARPVMTKKMIKLLSLLMKEDFEEEVIASIRHNWRADVNAYLQMLFPNDLATFTEELKIFAKEDETILYDWATDYYPNFIKDILASGAYKVANKVATIKHRLIKK